MDELNARSVKIDSLPFEIIEQIFNSPTLSFIDICKLSSVCQIFNCIGNSNKLWQSKYTQVWPHLAALYDPHDTNWKNEYRLRHEAKHAIFQQLKEMAIQFYHTDNVSNDSFLIFREICPDHPHGLHILIDALESIVYDSNRNHNLTYKYYAKRALRYMRHSYLETIWRKRLGDRQNPISLLKGACLISQWCQPTTLHCTCKVNDQINDIVKLTFQQIQKVSPNHPVIKRGLPVMKGEDSAVLEKSLWTISECNVVLSAINEVMYNRLQFRGNVDYFYSAENSFIDQVLKRKSGIPITLGIVYQTIASQLGVACLPVNFPGHFLLKWLEHPLDMTPDAYTFIDVYDKGAFRKSRHLDDFSPGYESFATSWLDAVQPVKVFTRMCWNLVEVGRQRDGEGEGILILCNALELLSILSPDDMEHKLLLARVYMHLCINMTRVICLLQEISEQDPVSTGIVGYMYRSAITTLETQRIRRDLQRTKCQRRDEANDVRFAVGMIMKHKKYNYRCVIYGWDSVCTASKDWIKQMGVYNLAYKDKQPFYLVLVDDGTNRYAAQENLELDNASLPIAHHSEVGRYFQSFHGNYYVPNDQKLREYPDDIIARERALASSSRE